MPHIEEVNRIIEVLVSIGVHVKWLDNNDLEIKPPAKLKLDQMDVAAGRKTRTIIMFMGPLMHLFKEFDIPFAGGCKLGERTVRPHLIALENFGLTVGTVNGWYHCMSKPKSAGKIIMYEMSETACENALMAAQNAWQDGYKIG